MRDQIEPKVTRMPFYLADAIVVGAAIFVYSQSARPLGVWQMAMIVGCVACGAVLSVAPFVFEYKAMVRVAEAGALTTVVGQIKNIESVAEQIKGATAQWQSVQEQSEQTAAGARQITERMAAEAKAFAEFMQRVNDNEKATLRLEVEKLRRAEAEWLQVLVRTLDHVYAFHQGALRSRQPNLIDQVSHFQNACREAARRVGVSPFIAADAEPYDAQRHQLVEGGDKPGEGAAVAETVAAGYTFQGKLIRPALVRLRQNSDSQATGQDPTEADGSPGQSQLPLEAAGASPS